ncbi:type II toxin-antitoxin system HicB family antitoxin [Synechocystis sp. CACIAM 05]|uniref:type II toxin-antitoxin system HicB family antitoxin n=1 Tax=Synechocystis sp. CACIAM 05 TaxID=1933929 RepID=UPI00138E8497|nr:type II toxin-antitoxin system HicB family antitoxin [Synechocystis sp. CACIAM 05]QHV00923.1 hypothetical protein BWK47_12795 [Synechocystis sp. CACIAM 05]
MKAELTAIIEASEDGANGQGNTIAEAKASLKSAIQLIVEDRLEDIRRGLPEEAIEETLLIP